MRSFLVAAAVLGLAVAALASRFVFAEPPPQSGPRDVKLIIEALKKKPAMKGELASVRFISEVLGETTLDVPVGSSPETLGPWGDNEALLRSELLIGVKACGPLMPAELKAAGSILADAKAAMPITLRAYTLGQQGKKKEAADLFATFVDQSFSGQCASEHPMYSYRRTTRMKFALKCLQAFAPERDLSAQQKKLEAAETCARNNHGVG